MFAWDENGRSDLSPEFFFCMFPGIIAGKLRNVLADNMACMILCKVILNP
jgi:hypothetical protein